jgi:hypothetical protein
VDSPSIRARLTSAAFATGLGLAIAACPWNAVAQPDDTGASGSAAPSHSVAKAGPARKVGAAGPTSTTLTKAVQSTRLSASAAVIGTNRISPTPVGRTARLDVALAAVSPSATNNLEQMPVTTLVALPGGPPAAVVSRLPALTAGPALPVLPSIPRPLDALGWALVRRIGSGLGTTTQGFVFRNESDQSVTFVGYGTPERPENGGPAPDTVVAPNQTIRFEVVYNFLKTTRVQALFTTNGGNTIFTANLSVGPFNEASSTCASAGGGQRCAADGKNLRFINAPGPNLAGLFNAVGGTSPRPADQLRGVLAGLLGTTTQGYTVYNLTGKPVTLVGYGTTELPENGVPKSGTVIPVGGTARIEVIYNFLRTTTVEPVFSTGPNGTIFTADLSVGPFNGASSTCGAVGGGDRCSADGKTVVLTQAAGGNTVIGPDQRETQARIIEALCKDGGAARCDFAPETQTTGLSTPKNVASPIINRGQNPIKRTLKLIDVVSQTDSLNITAKASFSNLTKTINAEIQTAYGHTWTNTKTFEEDIEVTTPPGYTTTITARQPVYRVTGTFTVVIDDTTFTLTGVQFDSPITSENFGSYEITDTPNGPPGSRLPQWVSTVLTTLGVRL